MREKRLIIFMPSIEGGGVEKNLFIISNYLSKKIKSISLITLSNTYKKKFNKKIKFISLKSNYWNLIGRRKKFFISLIILSIEIFKNRNSIVFCFQGNIYCTLLCKLLGIKIIVRSNTAPEGWSQNIIKYFLFKTIFKFANKIVVNSIDFKSNFKTRFNLDTICIYNPLDKEKIIKKSKKKVNVFFKKKFLNIINVGRFTDQKDQITLLKGLNLLKKKISFKLLILGRGIKKKELETFIEHNELNKNVKIINFQNNPYPYMKSADIFILSSIYEGLPNVLLESLVLNKFVISSNCPTGPNEILLNGKGGLLFQPRNYKQLANKIIYYLNNVKKCKKKLKYAQSKLKRFDYNYNLEKYYNLVKSQLY